MDIYRYFHPHHNPRLHSTALRQQELSELEQAASELLKAVERAKSRAERTPAPPILPEHFTDIIKALNFLVRSFQTLCDAHRGDTRGEMLSLIAERSEFSGWENWVNLVREQLASDEWTASEHHQPMSSQGGSSSEQSIIGNPLESTASKLKFGT